MTEMPADVALLPTGGILSLEGHHAWVIEAGGVEIYAQSAGKRRFLSLLSASGCVLFAVGTDTGLIALAPQGARLRRLSEAALAAMAGEAGDECKLSDHLDRWVEALSQGLSRCAVAEQQVVPLGPGPSQAIPPGSYVRAGTGVMWLRAMADASLVYMGLVDARIPAVPLTPVTFAVNRDPVTVTVATTRQLVAAGAWQSAAALFNGLVKQTTERWGHHSEDSESRRLDLQESLTLEELQAANTRLAGVMRGGHRQEPQDDIEFVLAKVTGRSVSLPLRNSPLAARCAALGYRHRPIVLSGKWWQEDRGRLIGFLGEAGTPVALTPRWRGGYWLHQRGVARRALSVESAKLLSTEAWILVEQLPNRPLSLRDLMRWAGRLSVADSLTLALAGFIAALLGLLMPLAMGAIVDLFIPDGLTHGLLLLGASLALLHLSTALLSFCHDLARLRIDGISSNALQAGIMDRVLRLPTRFLRGQSSADLSLRVLSVELSRRSLVAIVANSVLPGLFGLSSFGLLVYYAPAAAGVAALLLVLLLVASVLAGTAQQKAIATGEAMTANVSSLTLQMVQNISTLRAFGAERRAYSLWARNTAALRARGLRMRQIGILFETILTGYEGVALAIVFTVLGTSALGDHAASAGVYLTFVAAYQGILGSSLSLSRGIVALINLRPSVQRTEPLLKEAPETPPTARDPGPLSGELELSHIRFAYGQDGPPVLADVSVRVEAGEFVALVGPSGSGKSTLLNLVLGFDQPLSGVVLYGGKNLKDLDLAAVRRQIGVVRQGGKLLTGSIFENISGLHKGSIDEVWAAAELAQIADDIRALPMGMQTMIAEGAPSFSGGQIQRLLLARALVGRPKLMVLDEATSALDNRTQLQVAQSIDALGITRLVVAHRLSTVERADRLYFLANGRVLAEGNYASLLETCAEFRDFAARQNN